MNDYTVIQKCQDECGVVVHGSAFNYLLGFVFHDGSGNGLNKTGQTNQPVPVY
jgi:hypothetical protein